MKSNTRSAVQQTGHKQTAKVTAAEIEAMGGTKFHEIITQHERRFFKYYGHR